VRFSTPLRVHTYLNREDFTPRCQPSHVTSLLYFLMGFQYFFCFGEGFHTVHIRIPAETIRWRSNITADPSQKHPHFDIFCITNINIPSFFMEIIKTTRRFAPVQIFLLFFDAACGFLRKENARFSFIFATKTYQLR